MNETNEIKELKYTEEQVMRALMQMTPENREILLQCRLSEIIGLVNYDEIKRTILDEWNTIAKAYESAIKSVNQLVELLASQDNSTTSAIELMAEQYKGMSREERLQFSERIAEESDLDNSLDLSKSTWRKFLSRLA